MQLMLPGHVVPDQPSRHAAHQYIGGEMFLSQYARKADARGHRIPAKLHPVQPFSFSRACPTSKTTLSPLSVSGHRPFCVLLWLSLVTRLPGETDGYAAPDCGRHDGVGGSALE